MTDAEVAAMVDGEEKEIARRIARHGPTKPVGTLKSDNPAPPRVRAAELERIQRARGRLPADMRERLQRGGAAGASGEPKLSRKPYPTAVPPGPS